MGVSLRSTRLCSSLRQGSQAPHHVDCDFHTRNWPRVRDVSDRLEQPQPLRPSAHSARRLPRMYHETFLPLAPSKMNKSASSVEIEWRKFSENYSRLLSPKATSISGIFIFPSTPPGPPPLSCHMLFHRAYCTPSVRTCRLPAHEYVWHLKTSPRDQRGT